MRALIPTLALLAALALQPGSPAPPVPTEAVCESTARAFLDAYDAERNESSEARRRLLVQNRPLLDRFGTLRGRCTARLFDHQIILLTLDERYEDVVGLVDSVLATARFANSTDLRVRMLQNQSFAYFRLNRAAEDYQTLLRVAAEADSLPAYTAVRLMTDVVNAASHTGDLHVVDRYTAIGERIARDSLARDSTLYGGLGHLYIAHSLALLRQLDDEEDAARRQALARTIFRDADRTLALYHTGQEHITLDDLDRDIIAYPLKAVALAGLGRDDEARHQLDLAWQQVERAQFRDFAEAMVVDLQGVTFRLMGDWTSALASALRFQRLSEQESGLEGKAEAWYQVGTAADHLGRGSEAIDAYWKAIYLYEAMRESSSLQDWNAQAFVSAQRPYRALARRLVADGHPDTAFGVLERSRVRHLLDLRDNLEARDALPAATRDRADSLAARLADLRIRRQSGVRTPTEQGTVEADISRLNADIARLTGRGAHHPIPSVKAIQAVLARDGRVLVAPVMGETEGLAFVVTADTLVTVRLPIGLTALRAELRQIGAPWQPNGGVDPAFALAPLHRLHQALVAPLAAWLPDRAPLVVIPDPSLVGLPYGMLVERPATVYDQAAFLIRSHPVATELAATLFVDPGLPEERAPAYDIVAFGRSAYDRGASVSREAGGLLADLPSVAAEIKSVSAHARHGKAALNEDATEARLDAVIGDARVVHLAAHAEPDVAFPLYSRVYLWDGPDDDGALHVYELLNQRLSADLVVLSGCSTARGPAVAGEGLIGLQHAVRAAGARSSLATLWPVEDRAMVEIVDVFYDGLADGLEKDRALQQAQLAYLDGHHGLEASPFYWAALVLSGDVAPVPLQRPTQRLWLFGLLAVGLGAAGLAWALARRRRRA